MPLIDKFRRAEHDAMHRWTGMHGVGLGQSWYEYIPLWPSERESDPCAPAPPWCAYTAIPFYKIKECMPLSEAERIMCQQREFGPAMTPEMREQALQKGSESEKAYLEVLKREEPAKAQAFEDYEKIRKCIDSGQSAFWCEYSDMIMWSAFGIVAFMMLSRR